MYRSFERNGKNGGINVPITDFESIPRSWFEKITRNVGGDRQFVCLHVIRPARLLLDWIGYAHGLPRTINLQA